MRGARLARIERRVAATTQEPWNWPDDIPPFSDDDLVALGEWEWGHSGGAEWRDDADCLAALARVNALLDTGEKWDGLRSATIHVALRDLLATVKAKGFTGWAERPDWYVSNAPPAGRPAPAGASASVEAATAPRGP